MLYDDFASIREQSFLLSYHIHDRSKYIHVIFTMKRISENNEAVLHYDIGDECEIIPMKQLRHATCVNLGNSDTLSFVISVLDCRMEMSGKAKTGCYILEDGNGVVCPSKNQMGHVELDIFETILQVFDFCEASSVDVLKETTLVLSSKLSKITKEVSEDQENSRNDLERIVRISGQLSDILEDSLLIGNQLLGKTKSFRRFKESVKNILDEFQANPTFHFHKTGRISHDIMMMDLDTFLGSDAWPESQSLNDGLMMGYQSPLCNLVQLGRLYSVLCVVLVACILSRSLGNGIFTISLVTLLNVARTAIAGGDYMSFAIDTFVSHAFCLLFYVIVRVVLHIRSKDLIYSQDSLRSRVNVKEKSDYSVLR